MDNIKNVNLTQATNRDERQKGLWKIRLFEFIITVITIIICGSLVHWIDYSLKPDWYGSDIQRVMIANIMALPFFSFILYVYFDILDYTSEKKEKLNNRTRR